MLSSENCSITAYMRKVHRFSLISPEEEKELVNLKMRYGLDGDTQKTLKEVGDRLGVTRERTRQIQQHALDKLRYLIAESI